MYNDGQREARTARVAVCVSCSASTSLRVSVSDAQRQASLSGHGALPCDSEPILRRHARTVHWTSLRASQARIRKVSRHQEDSVHCVRMSKQHSHVSRAHDDAIRKESVSIPEVGPRPTCE